MDDEDERIPDPANPLDGGRPTGEDIPEADEGLEPEPPALELWSEVGDVRPWGTLLLLLAWAAMFALSGAVGAFAWPGGLTALGASATGMPAGETAWRLLASTFLHAGVAHVFFNGTSMMVVGPAVERIFTRWRFWIVYVAGGAAASFASLAWREARDGSSLSVGASGAIFALGGALLAAIARLRRQLPPTRARALAAAVLYLIAPGFAAGYARPGTDNVAHAVGIASGALLGFVLPLDARLGGRPVGALTRVVVCTCALALAVSFAMAVRGALTGP